VGAVLAAFRADPAAYAPVEREALAAFPYEAREDGACEQLDGTGCRVYDDRPLICRVDAIGAARGWDQATTWWLSARACDALQTEAGLPTAYRVVLPLLSPSDVSQEPVV
jgi:Fe-S-cluster containining protein